MTDQPLPANAGTPQRPCFVGQGRVALRREGRWYAQDCAFALVDTTIETLHPVNTKGRALAPVDVTAPVPVARWDEAGFQPVTDPAAVAALDRWLRLRLELLPPLPGVAP